MNQDEQRKLACMGIELLEFAISDYLFQRKRGGVYTSTAEVAERLGIKHDEASAILNDNRLFKDMSPGTGCTQQWVMRQTEDR